MAINSKQKENKMENKLQLFENEEFGRLEVMMLEGKPYFPATDCARLLGYAKPHDAVSRHCCGSVKHGVIDSLGRKQEANFIPEGDLYRLIIRSKLPAAERFEKWVFDEVLPSIRSNGGYIAGQEAMTPEELVASALIVANSIIDKQKAQLEEQKPKVALAEAITASEGSILVGDMAKILKSNGYPTGQNRFYETLRECGYIQHKNCLPTQRGMELGLFELREIVITRENGSMFKSITTMVTGKGQEYFINKFIGV